MDVSREKIIDISQYITFSPWLSMIIVQYTCNNKYIKAENLKSKNVYYWKAYITENN